MIATRMKGKNLNASKEGMGVRQKTVFGRSIAEGIEQGSELKPTSLKDYGCRIQISLLAFSIAIARGILASIPFYMNV